MAPLTLAKQWVGVASAHTSHRRTRHKRRALHRARVVGRTRHTGPVNVYAATASGTLSPSVAHLPQRVYVPNTGNGTVDVIDPRTFRVVDQFLVGEIPHHIAPSWDLSKLYVDNEQSSSLTVIDPRTGKPTGTIPVDFPYNLYFTPDGRKAIVVVERLSRLDFRDPLSLDFAR
jgi:YVTN family beta-propeller protein